MAGKEENTCEYASAGGKDQIEDIKKIDPLVSELYDLKRVIGKGAYGIVWRAVDRATQEQVAVKKVYSAFENDSDAQKIYREVVFLRSFKSHPNIVQLVNIHRAANDLDFYLVFERMTSDLQNAIEKGILLNIHIKFVTYQLLSALNFVHSGNVLHRDLKPGNILINRQCICKLADFGLSRCVGPSYGIWMDYSLTDYVGSRWYRAPEILAATRKYTKGADMWSLGCVVGEMLIGKPLFKGSTLDRQWRSIMSSIPQPSEKDMHEVMGQRKPSLGELKSRPLAERFADADTEGTSLVVALLSFHPATRLTAAQALGHPFVSACRKPEEEITLESPVVPELRDDIEFSVRAYRRALYRTVAEFADESGGNGRKQDAPPASTSSSGEQPRSLAACPEKRTREESKGMTSKKVPRHH